MFQGEEMSELVNPGKFESYKKGLIRENEAEGRIHSQHTLDPMGQAQNGVGRNGPYK